MDGLLELTLASVFLAGLMAGAHCAAMCGPLIGIACGPRARAAGRAQWLYHALAYNAGRIAAYIAAGALTGSIGAAGLATRGTPLVQQLMLVTMGISLILMAGYIAGVAPLRRVLEAAGSLIWRRIEPWSRRFLPVTTPLRAFGLGLVWGWVPCGMVYVALLAALSTADPLQGALVMAAFGLGTLPNLLALSASLEYVARVARGRLVRLLFSVVIAAIGIFGIVKAAHPSGAYDGGFGCPGVPGIAALFSSGRP